MGVLVLGLLLGGLSSLLAGGLVLIWRAHRFLNLAHGAMGLVAGVLVAALVGGAGWNVWLALPVGLGVGAGLGLVTETVLIGRLGWAPRPILMVGSLGLAYVYGAFQASLPPALGGLPRFEIPLPVGIDIFPVHFGGTHVAAAVAVPVCLGGLALFLRVSRLGLAVRAAAQNPDRARSLGVPVRAVSMVVWGVAGALAAVGGILAVPILGLALEAGPGTTVLLLALAPAVVARMRSLPAAVAASLLVGAAYQSALWMTPRAGIADVVVLAVVVAAFGLQTREGLRRREAAERTSWRAFAGIRPLPPAVISRTGVRVARWAGTAGFWAAALLVPLALGPADAQRYGVVAIFALAAVSVCIVSGFAGRLSFGHWAVVGVGAWTAGGLAGHTGYEMMLPVAAVAGAVASVLVGLPSLRAGPFAYAVTTLAAAVAAAGLLAADPLLRRVEPVPAPVFAGYPLDTNTLHTVFAVAVLGTAVWLVRRIRAGGFGRRLVALRDDETLAAAHGVRRATSLLGAYAVSGAFAGVAGALYLHNQHLVHPESFAAERSLLLLGAVVVGGLGSVGGAVAGAVLVYGATLFLPGAWTLLGTGAGMLAVLLLLPGGLAGLADRTLGTLRPGGTSPGSVRPDDQATLQPVEAAG